MAHRVENAENNLIKPGHEPESDEEKDYDPAYKAIQDRSPTNAELRN